VSTEPYYADDDVTLYLGDMREVLPALALTVDAIIADPPYGETALAWDRWPDGWPTVAATVARSMWCFGSMRMFLDRRDEFAGWRMSQDIVWQKHTGSGPAADRFKRIHEHAVHWYRGPWGGIHHDPPRIPATAGQLKRNGTAVRTSRGVHIGNYGQVKGWTETGTRIVQSVIVARSMHRRAIHPTEKPPGILDPLIRYACPPGGTVLDWCAGSGSTAVAARLSGRKSVLIEADERYCEAIVRRLQQDVLPTGVCDVG
jgi:site-specific DNA-methyltransferase (adenine-specific)